MDEHSIEQIKHPKSSIDETGLETNLYVIAEEIFSQQPKPPLSIQLLVDHDQPETCLNQTVLDPQSFEFEIISKFALYGFKRLIRPKILSQTISDHDFTHFNQYLISFGYFIVYDLEITSHSVLNEMRDEDFLNCIQIKRYQPSIKVNLDHLQKYMAK